MPRHRHRGPRGPLERLVAAALIGGLAAAGVTGCGPSTGPGTVADQARAAGGGYIAGDGSIERLAVDKRGTAVQLTGQTLQGGSWSSSSAIGKVVVLNVWGSWCPPCEAEMPHLQAVWSQLAKAGRPVAFVGVNSKESAATAAAAATRYGLTYPSLADDGGRTIMALQGKVVATPTTLILDRSGRIAVRVSGPISSPTTLRDLVTQVLAEPVPG